MTVYSLFKEQVQKNADSIAIEFGSKSLTFAELSIEVNRMTSYLENSGIKKGDIVGISLNRSIEMIISLLSIIKSGAIYLPLDPDFPSKRLLYMLEDSSCPFLITENAIIKSFENYKGRKIDISEYGRFDFDNTEVEINEESIVYILYTSGSTGNPKGVQITHKSLVNFLHSMKATPGLNSKDSLLAITTLSFDISGLEIFLPLITGAKVVISSKKEATDGKLLLEKLKNVTVMQATPATWKLLIDSGWKDKLKIKALCGGEELSRDLADKLLERVDELWNMYGPTETTIWSSCSKVEKGSSIISLGKPIANTQFYIVDKHNQFCAPGVPGELLIGGKGLSIGYLHRDDLTNENFIPNPFDKQNRTKLYKTGDLVRLTTRNEIEFLGRIDNQVKIRGFRIELGEVENAIRSNENVKDTAVIVKEFNKNDKRLFAFFIPDFNTSTSNHDSDLVDKWKNQFNYLYKTALDEQDKEENRNIDLDYTIAHVLNHDKKNFAKGFNEWLSQTVERIIKLKPRRVLEIGCGGGQLLKLIAPSCDYYAATDISEISIKTLELQLQGIPSLVNKVDLFVQAADADLTFKKKSFDTIILNSVVQYFPSQDYLLRVIYNLLDFLDEEGCIYLGDIQSNSLLRNYHLNDQLHHLTEHENINSLKKIVEQRVQNEEELVVDPEFFYAMKISIPQLSRVEAKIRRGRVLNETTQYHYDVFIYSGGKNKPEFISQKMYWGKDVNTYDDLELILSKDKPDIYYLANVPNKRIFTNIEREKLIDSSPDNLLVSEALLNLKHNDDLVDPEDMWALGERLNYDVELIIPVNFDQLYFDAVFILKNKKINFEIRQSNLSFRELNKYSNRPKTTSTNQSIVNNIKNRISEQLPDYMVPSYFIPIEKLPLTPNGKINRKELMDYNITGLVLPKPENGTKNHSYIRLSKSELIEVEKALKKNDFINNAIVVEKEFDGEKFIIAYYNIKQNYESEEKDSERREHIEKWKKNYDHIYENALTSRDNNSSDIGYRFVSQFEQGKSYLDQFNVWINETTKRIRKLKPNRVLEIGCGGGDILKRIISDCSFYCATDLSPKIIEYLGKELKNPGKKIPEVKLFALPADADLPFERGYFDTIIMNSVAVHFPDEGYLTQVVNKLMNYLNENGCFFIGDIQFYSLQKNQYLCEQLDLISSNIKIHEFSQIIDSKIRTAPDLFIDPVYFYNLAKTNSRIKRVEVKLMRGSLENDPSTYHYDVFIYPESKKKISNNVKKISWNKDINHIEEISLLIRNEMPEILYIKDIPNKRLGSRIEIQKAIENASSNDFVKDILNSIKHSDNYINPEDIWDLENIVDYNIDLLFPENCDPLYFDAVFIARNIENEITYPLQEIEIFNSNQLSYCNEPISLYFYDHFKTKLKENLSTTLPENIRPTLYIPISSFPMTKGNQIDRDALMNYNISSFINTKYVKKSYRQIEEKVLEIWERLLNIKGIEVDEGFFEVGGHSILAISLINKLNEQFDVDLPLSLIFDAPTISKLSDEIINVKKSS
ncbi:MAG: amino acid adenylation domain-containing protein [Ignavibacteriaceae bacterium]